MGARGEVAQALTGSEPGRRWPLVVRRATASDRDSVLAFATRTWDDWDYVPHAWPVWLTAADGALLVGCVGRPADGSADLVDAEGSPLDIGRVVAITRVSMVSPTEAWLEGIRVHPRVRGMGVAGDLQVAELQWVAAQGATVMRYATGADNVASHRLGARDGINLIARFSSWWWNPTGVTDDGHDAPSAFDTDVRVAATAARQAALARLRAAGLIASAERDDLAELWRRLSHDTTFLANRRLYEPRAWAMNELTADLFRRHVERGEVVVDPAAQEGGDRWAVAIIVREQLPSEDSDLRFALLAGHITGAIELEGRVRLTIDQPVHFRIERDAPLAAAVDEWRSVGVVSPKWQMHLLAREMSPDDPIPAVDPGRLVLAEAPDRIEPPRW